MTTKEYLKKAFYLDQNINSKIEQLHQLNDLATKCTTVYSLTPASRSNNNSKLEKTVTSIIMLQDEINTAIDELVDLKAEMFHKINAVEDDQCKTLLELRYLNFHKFEEIAVLMDLRIRNVHYIHEKALKMIKI